MVENKKLFANSHVPHFIAEANVKKHDEIIASLRAQIKQRQEVESRTIGAKKKRFRKQSTVEYKENKPGDMFPDAEPTISVSCFASDSKHTRTSSVTSTYRVIKDNTLPPRPSGNQLKLKL
jgi:hypothetical protein